MGFLVFGVGAEDVDEKVPSQGFGIEITFMLLDDCFCKGLVIYERPFAAEDMNEGGSVLGVFACSRS